MCSIKSLRSVLYYGRWGPRRSRDSFGNAEAAIGAVATIASQIGNSSYDPLLMVMTVAGGPSEAELERLTWEEIGKAAKQIENEIDGNLLVLGRLASAALRSQRYDASRSTAPGDSPLRKAEGVADKIQTALSKLSVYIDALAQRSDQAGSSATLHILQRHRDICAEYTQEFRKTKAPIGSACAYQRTGTLGQCARKRRTGDVRARRDQLLRAGRCAYVPFIRKQPH